MRTVGASSAVVGTTCGTSNGGVSEDGAGGARERARPGPRRLGPPDCSSANRQMLSAMSMPSVLHHVGSILAEAHLAEQIGRLAKRREDAEVLDEAGYITRLSSPLSQRTCSVKRCFPAETSVMRGSIFFGIVISFVELGPFSGQGLTLGFVPRLKLQRSALDEHRLRGMEGTYRIASIPLRRMTLSSARAAPVGRLAPRSNCDT